MRTRDLSLTIALCTSLVAHGVLALVTFEGARRQLASIRLPAFPRNVDVIRAAPPDTANLGGTTNDGLAPNASPGNEWIRAELADVDQALLSRDPQGPGRIGGPPSDSLAAETDGPTGDATQILSVRAPPAPSVAAADVPRPFGAGPDAAALLLAPRVRRPQLPAREQSTVARINKPPADPAIMSPSESDAFSQLGGIEFRDGRMESRLGRAFKSVRPELSLAAQIDLMGMTDEQRRIELKIRIDAMGKVVDVDVLRSTGSDLIDQPVKLAMYQWWFEPPKGPDGHAMGETIVFPIRWN